MIGIDTNVLVRYLVQDDKVQSLQASKLIENVISVDEPGFITLITLVEVVWVLNSCYGVNKTQLCSMIKMVLETKQLLIEQAESCYRALRVFESSNGDFSDALIATISKDAGCSETVTFDKKAQSVGMKLISN
jgi:predicted nucleic-acid-binding protein